jgi:peptidoglycan/xylan/chitin deacetylase (PgdA/CDA1 family)
MHRGIGTTGTFLGGAIAVLLAAAPAQAAVRPAPDAQVTLDGTAGVGPVALRRASLVQSGDDLVLRVATAEAWNARGLRSGAGRRICFSAHGGAGGRETYRLCVGWSRDALRARGSRIRSSGVPTGWHAVRARIGRPNQSIVQVRAPLAAFGARPGLVRWSASSSWNGTAECPTADACTSGLPTSGAASYRARQTVPIGCVPSGPTMVRRGPQGTGPKRVALTFDDGPWQLTSQFLDVLRHYDVPATFFMIGRQVGAQAELLRRMVREGHALGNHTWSHADIAGGNVGQVTETNAAIHAATGVTPCLLRPPGGATSAALDGQLRSEGMLDVLWTVDPSDWRTPGTAAVTSRVLSAVVPGAIVLLHDGGGPRGGTLAALPTIITTLRARGYQLVTVPQLLGLHERVGYR